MKVSTQIEPIVPLTKYSHDIIEDYSLKHTEVKWVNDLIVELEEEIDKDEAAYPSPEMTIDLQITRKTNNFLGDHLIAKAQIESTFHLACGRCLAALPQKLNLSVNAAFLHDSKEKLPEYEESTTVFADGQEMELYFIRKGMADLNEFIHEQIFMEVEHFPRCEGECKNPIHF